jgi:hypothetical protein
MMTALARAHDAFFPDRLVTFGRAVLSQVQGHVDAYDAGGEVSRVFAARSEGGRTA